MQLLQQEKGLRKVSQGDRERDKGLLKVSEGDRERDKGLLKVSHYSGTMSHPTESKLYEILKVSNRNTGTNVKSNVLQ